VHFGIGWKGSLDPIYGLFLSLNSVDSLRYSRKNNGFDRLEASCLLFFAGYEFIMRNAWLIIAHNEFAILQMLVSALDMAESDVYIHIDKKVSRLPSLKVREGRLFMLDNRMDVRWGSVSQIEVELLLMAAASKNGPYAHYHILSGTHLPLKPVEDLMAFYDAHAEETVVRYWPKDSGDADFKLRRYHFPLGHFKYGGSFRRHICQKTWQGVIKVQKVLGIRHLKGEVFVKTDNWLSLSDQACQYLINHKNDILHKYRWSFCGDEYFAATELMKGGLPLYDYPQLLYVEFQGDTPRTFPVSAVDALLKKTNCLWARKFTMDSADGLD